ncbi:hypothetical protein [Pseudozobellia sp. WGM2]|uniref:hypothetical protein n=1 Tax=Pseudozobellia sp. WGM2 TaxID=2787625 RepID=UPI001AE0DD57|nr:hypothetical protein [Pseudozobellia sp. WGM2]
MKQLVFYILLFSITDNLFAQLNTDFDSNWQSYSRQGLGSDQQDIGAVYGKLNLDYRVIVQGEMATIKIKLNRFTPDNQNAYHYPNHGRTYNLDALNKLGISTSRYNTEVKTNYRVDEFEAVEVIFECLDDNHNRIATAAKGLKRDDEWFGPFIFGNTYSIRLPLQYADKEKFYACVPNTGITLKKFILTGGTQQTDSNFINKILDNPSEVENNTITGKNESNSFNEKDETSNIESSTVIIKKPYEYSKEEWESMSNNEQQESLKYQLNQLNTEASSQNVQINEQLQSQGYASLMQGDFAGAITSLSEAGDSYGAMAAVGVGMTTSLIKDIKEARNLKKRNAKEHYTSTLVNVEELIQQSNRLLLDKDVQSYFLKEIEIMKTNLEALAWINAANTIENSDYHNKLVESIESFSRKRFEYNEKGHILDDYQKIQLYLYHHYELDDLSIHKKYQDIFQNLELEKQKFLISSSLSIHNNFREEVILSGRGINSYTTNNSIFSKKKDFYDLKLAMVLNLISSYDFNPAEYFPDLANIKTDKVLFKKTLKSQTLNKLLLVFELKNSQKGLRKELNSLDLSSKNNNKVYLNVVNTEPGKATGFGSNKIAPNTEIVLKPVKFLDEKLEVKMPVKMNSIPNEVLVTNGYGLNSLPLCAFSSNVVGKKNQLFYNYVFGITELTEERPLAEIMNELKKEYNIQNEKYQELNFVERDVNGFKSFYAEHRKKRPPMFGFSEYRRLMFYKVDSKLYRLILHFSMASNRGIEKKHKKTADEIYESFTLKR